MPLFLGGRRVEVKKALHPPAQVRHDAGEAIVVPIQQDLPGAGRQVSDRHLEREPVTVGDALEGVAEKARAMTVPGSEGSLEDAAAVVGDDGSSGIHRPATPQPVARGAGPLRAIEGERAGAQRRHRDVASGAREVAAVQALAPTLDGDEHDAPGEVQGRLQARPQPRLRPGAQRQTVDEHVDAVAPPGVESDRAVEVCRFAVDAGAEEAGLAGRGELLAVAAFRPRATGAATTATAPRALLEKALGDLLGALRGDGVVAPGTVGPAKGREEDPQVIEDLGDRSDRRAGMGHRRPLFDRHRRREAGHRLDVRALHLLEELAGPW